MPDTATASFLLTLTRIYQSGLRVVLILIPLTAILYIHLFGNPEARITAHLFHEIAISVAIIQSAFVSYVTWQCYRFSGETFLYWVAQGLTGFTLVYLPHGILTRMSDCNIWLFLLYGPASRIVMLFCLFIGLLHYGKDRDSEAHRRRMKPFWNGIMLFMIINLCVAVVSYSAIADSVWLRKGMESIAILLAGAGMFLVAWRRITSPLMHIYAVAMAIFAQASFSFILAKPWNHQWWLAHALSAGGFSLLSYGIVQAFRTTRAFSAVYSQEEIMRQLECTNNELQRLAAEDPLTGASNRRHFLMHADKELARAQRENLPVSLMIIDFDHFKEVNDCYGHQAGDTVLKNFVKRTGEVLRPSDLLGRFGGEEFIVLLPNSTLLQAANAAERIREAMDRHPIPLPEAALHVTVSIGVAEFGYDGATVDEVIKSADDRLYSAKESGRNRVVAERRS